MAEFKFPTDGVFRFLSIGNSHTNNSTSCLYEIFKAEMPQQKVFVGNMYHSGCSVKQHLEFDAANGIEYWYMKNYDGDWDNNKEATLEDGLVGQPWDLVILHEMNVNYITTGNFDNDNLKNLKALVEKKVTSDPVFFWNMGWANPTDEELIYTMAKATNEEIYKNWRQMYVDRANLDYTTMYEKLVNTTKESILPKHDFKKVIPTGAAFWYAREKMGATDKDLYVDYTHANDFGCLLAGYVWYGIITGQKEITEVKVNSIPAKLRHISVREQGDLEITPAMKQIIKESVNFALKQNF